MPIPTTLEDALLALLYAGRQKTVNMTVAEHEISQCALMYLQKEKLVTLDRHNTGIIRATKKGNDLYNKLVQYFNSELEE